MRSIVLCGSKRFKPEMRTFANVLKEKGITVYEPYLHAGIKEGEGLSDDYKRYIALGLTHDHFYKIRMADIVFLFNKDGYAGVSTTLELGYAIAMGKPVYALSEDTEPCRNVLIRGYMTDPADLVPLLQ